MRAAGSRQEGPHDDARRERRRRVAGSRFGIIKSGQILVRGTAPGDPAPRSAILTPLD